MSRDRESAGQSPLPGGSPCGVEPPARACVRNVRTPGGLPLDRTARLDEGALTHYEAERVRRAVDEAPPLTAERKEQLRAILVGCAPPPGLRVRHEASRKHGDHLYVIGDGSGVVKVGRARDVGRRLREIQTSYPRDLLVLHVYYGAGRLESHVHRLLQSSNCRGEWFDFGDRDAVAEVDKAVERAYESEGPHAYKLGLFLNGLAEAFGPAVATRMAEGTHPAAGGTGKS